MSDPIAGFRSRWGAIFRVNLKDIDFIYRPLTLGELNGFGTEVEEEDVIDLALLSPRDVDFDNLPAGIISSLVGEIIRSSAGDYESISEELAIAKERLTHIHQQLKIVVLCAFPSYLEESLNDLTLPQLIHKAALAQEVITLSQQVAMGSEINLEAIDKNLVAPEPPPMRDPLGALLEDRFAAPPPEPEVDQKILSAARPRAGDPIAAKLRQAAIVELGDDQ